jgi:hypothetical protein
MNLIRCELTVASFYALDSVHSVQFTQLTVDWTLDCCETAMFHCNISTEKFVFITVEYLDMQKLCAKWVPRVLTIDQNQQRVDDSCTILSTRFFDIFDRVSAISIIFTLRSSKIILWTF